MNLGVLLNYKGQYEDHLDCVLFEEYPTPNVSAVPVDLDSLYDIFVAIVGHELKQTFEIREKYNSIGNKVVNHNTIKNFIDKLFAANCPRILKYNNMEQQVYLLYVIGLLFYKYNDDVIKLNKEDFIEQIYFPNIISICVKFMPQAKKFFYKTIKQVHGEVQEKSKDVIEFYAELYNADENAIKNDIMYLFLITMMTQFNPLELDEDIDDFYSSLFRRMFFFYLKSKTSGLSNIEVDFSIVQDENLKPISERYRIYEEALYLAQIQLMCSDSSIMNRISSQYDKMKSSIIPNEIQRLYMFIVNEGRCLISDDKVLLLRTQNELNNVDEIKNKMPQIYKVLRSIHVISDTPTFLESDKKLIHDNVYSVLYAKFHNVLTDDILAPIIHKITDNLVRSLTTGEFIDVITLTRVNISISKFNEQLRLFLNTVLDGLGDNKLSALHGVIND